jgi:PAS domain S-box-containing protein
MTDPRGEQKDCKAVAGGGELERAFPSLPEMVAIIDRQYRIVRVNEAVARRIGIRAEECIGRHCYEIMHGLSEPPESCPHSRALKDGCSHVEEVHEERWGTVLMVSVTPLKDEQGAVTGVVQVAHDITERKQVESRLRESEAMLARAQEMAHVGHWERDIRARKVRWSDETYRILGLKPQEREVYPGFIFQYIHPEDRPRMEKALENTEKGVRPYNERYRVIRPDGTTRWLQSKAEVTRAEDGAPLRIFGTILDFTERKEMEEALRSSEEAALAILNASQETIFLIDTSGIVLAANAATAHRLGTEPAEMIGRNIFDFMPADVGQTRNTAGQEAIRTGKPVAFDDERMGRYFDNLVYPICNEAGEVTRLVISAHDITVRKQLEEELRRSRDELELRVRQRTAEVVETMEALKIEVEMRKHSQQLLSEARTLATGLSSASDLQNALNLCLDTALRLSTMDFGGIYLIDRISGHLHLAAHRNLPDSLLAGVMDYDQTSANFRLVEAGLPVYARWKDLGLLPADSSDVIRGIAIVPICHEGKPVACLNLASFVFDDIPEVTRTGVETVAAQMGGAFTRIQAEEERRKLAAAVERSGEGMIIIDGSSRIEYVNPALARMTGYSQEELIGKDARTLQAEVMDNAAYDASREQVRMKGYVLIRSKAKRKDGSYVPVESFLSAVRGANGDVGGYIVRCRDLTEQIMLEEQLRQSQKMEAVGTLAGGIAHDFNNILAIILGNAELAEDEDDHRAIKQNIAQIVNASKRARELVRQILTFSRKNEQNRVNMRLIPLVEETYRLMRASIPSTIAIDLKITTDADIVFADSTEMQQILMNLVANAAHAMKDGGRLRITLSDAAFDPSGPFPEPGMRAGEYIKITVTDTGTGMTAEVRKRIFDPFFTTKEVGYGTGMGLAVVYGIVKSHEGAITVHSRPGRGSTFNVFLPKPHTSEMREVKDAEPIPRGTERILVVDDEEPVAATLRLTLERLGYRVTATTSPAEAWKLFREEGYDVVITDQTMPGITGLELARKMLKARKSIPVILCTGFSETASPEKAESAGITEYLLKPVDKKELARTVRKVLDRTNKV